MTYCVNRTYDGLHERNMIKEGFVYEKCSFVKVNAEGVHLSGTVFIDCVFDNSDFYWCYGDGVKFLRCKFDHCDLRGSFYNTIFIECDFEFNQYGTNNLGGTTEWIDTVVINCTINGDQLPI